MRALSMRGSGTRADERTHTHIQIQKHRDTQVLDCNSHTTTVIFFTVTDYTEQFAAPCTWIPP